MPNRVILAELTAQVWPTYLRSNGAFIDGTWLNSAMRIPVNAAKTYRVTGKARRNAAANGFLYVGVALFDASGGEISGDGFQWFYLANGVTANTAWTTYTGTFGAGTAKTFPGGAAFMCPLVGLNYNNTLGYMECMELWIEDTAAAGVEISADRYMRDVSAWPLRTGLPIAGRYTLTGAEGDALAQTRTLRYATAGYTTLPSDTPSRAFYDGRVVQPGLVRTELPADWTGPVSASYGELVLANGDGALGELAYYGLDGQALTLKMGNEGASYSTFTTVLRATMEQAVVDRSQVRIRLRGPDARLNRPLLSARYLGNNSLPAGLEGSSDLTGRVKPRVYGTVYGIAPPCVNTTRRIYQVSENYIGVSTTNVYDAGVALTGGSDYSSQSDMETNAPSAGQYRAWPAGGMFRLGSAAAGEITCNATALSSGHGNPWELWNVLWQVAYDAGVQSSEIAQAQNYTWQAPDFWADDWATTEPNVGVWVDDLRSATDVMTELAASLGVWFGFARTSVTSMGALPKFTAEPFPPPFVAWSSYGQARMRFDESHILGVQAMAAPGEGRGVPAWQVSLSYRKNYTPLSPSQAPSVAPTALGLLATDSRSVTAQSASVQTKHTTAVTLQRQTRIADDSAGALLEAARQLELRRKPRPWFELRLALDAVLASNRYPVPVLGGLTYVRWPELKLLWNDGTTRAEGWFTVHALELDFGRNEARMTVRQAEDL